MGILKRTDTTSRSLAKTLFQKLYKYGFIEERTRNALQKACDDAF